MNLTYRSILAEMERAYAEALADPKQVKPVELADSDSTLKCRLRTDVYDGPKGRGFAVVATVDRGFDKMTIVKQHGPEILRDKPFEPQTFSKLLFIRELDTLGKQDEFFQYLELQGPAKLKRQWDACTCIMSDDESFSEIAPLVQALLGLTGTQFEALLKRCETAI